MASTGWDGISEKPDTQTHIFVASMPQYLEQYDGLGFRGPRYDAGPAMVFLSERQRHKAQPQGMSCLLLSFVCLGESTPKLST